MGDDRFHFRIPIGDWSGDGHGKCENFPASAAKPIDSVREAYFAAKARHPKICPEEFCHEYEDSSVPEAVAKAVAEAGGPKVFAKEDEGPGADGMAEYVVWFLNQGDPDLDAKLEPNDIPSLAFYGADPKGRHIRFIGYGLFYG